MKELRQQCIDALNYINDMEGEYAEGQRNAYSVIIEWLDESPQEEAPKQESDIEREMTEELSYIHEVSKEQEGFITGFRCGFIKGSEWQSQQGQEAIGEWISVEDRLPEVHESVLVQTEYNSIASGNPVLCHDIFVGYLAEDGDLILMPEEESYGWSFKDCVTHWMPLFKPPKKK